MEGEMGFEHMQLFSVSRTYGKTFPETFCVRARLKYLPRIIGGGGRKKTISRMSWQKPLACWFVGYASVTLCVSLCFTWCMPSQGSSEYSGEDWKLLRIHSPLCSSCLFFLSDFRKLVRYKTRNNKSEGKNPGSSAARWYSPASFYWSLNFSTREEETILLYCSLPAHFLINRYCTDSLAGLYGWPYSKAYVSVEICSLSASESFPRLTYGSLLSKSA